MLAGRAGGLVGQGAKRKREGEPRTHVQAQSESRKQSANFFRLELHAHVSLEHVCY